MVVESDSSISHSSLRDDTVHSKIPEVDELVNDSVQSKCSQSEDYSMSRSDSMITLEDFLAESNKSADSRVSCYVDRSACSINH